MAIGTALVLALVVVASEHGLGETVPAAAPQAQTGVTVSVAPAARVSWAEMQQIEARRPAGPGEPRAIPRMEGPGPREIGPGEPSSRASVEPPPDGWINDRGPFASLDRFIALPDAAPSIQVIPPDTMGAVGPDHLMVMLNSEVRIQTKGGGNLNTVSLDSFWSSLTGDPFDPKLLYDPLDDRWLATVDADGNSSTSSIFFAVSDGSDPTGTWTFYEFDSDSGNTTWADFPGFGVNDTWIAITNNMFTVSSTPEFEGVKMWVIDKSTALAGGALTTTIFDPGFDTAGGFDGFTLKPALTFDPAEGTLYILDNSGFSSGGTPLMRLSRITGTGGSPSWSVVPGSTFSGTGFFFVDNDFEFTMIEAAQQGTATTVDSGDPRMTDPVLRNGSIWATHTAGLPNGGPVDRTAVFWYELDPTGMPDPIVQSGVLDPGAGGHHFYPSITANSADDAAIGFSRSDSGRFIESVATGRAASDPAGTTRSIRLIKAGEDSYVKDFGGPRVRWGDYSATVVDPSDDLTFWTIQEYAAQDVGGTANDDRWSTFWERNGAALRFFIGSADDEESPSWLAPAYGFVIRALLGPEG